MVCSKTERIEANLYQEWYSIQECCELKGIHIKTAQNTPWLLPNGGKPDGIVGKRKRWHRSTVSKWLLQTDDELLGKTEEVLD